MASKIRHLAIRAENPNKLAKFYGDVFGMTLVQKIEKTGTYMMTDGYMNVAILKSRHDRPVGIEHFGFQIDDSAAIADKMEKSGAARPQKGPHDPPYAESRGLDPEGNRFDLSVHGYEEDEREADRAIAKEKV